MPVQVTCPQGHRLSVPDKLAGKRIRCPKCKEVVLVPGDVPTPISKPVETIPLAKEEAPSQPPTPQAPVPTSSFKGNHFISYCLILLLLAAAAFTLWFLIWPPAGDPSSKEMQRIRTVGQQFVNALKNRDEPTGLATLSGKARQAIQAEKEFKITQIRDLQKGDTVQISEPYLQGEIAQLPVMVRGSGREERLVLLLRLEDNEWRVFGFSVPQEPGAGPDRLTINLENPGTLLDQVVGNLPGEPTKSPVKDKTPEGEDELTRMMAQQYSTQPRESDLANEALTSMDRTGYEKAWKRDLNGKGKPALEALRKLASDLTWALETTPAQEKTLAKPVALGLQGRSSQELFEEVARQAGFFVFLAPELVSPGKFKVRAILKPFPLPQPVVHTGPFRVEILELDEFPPHATGLLKIRGVGAGFPLPLKQAVSTKTNLGIQIDRVTDAKDRDLRDLDSTRVSGLSTSTPGMDFEQVAQIPLRNLVREVSALKTIRGHIRFQLPTRVESVPFEKLVSGASKKVGPIELVLSNVQRNESTFNNKKWIQHSLAITCKGINPGQIRLLPYDSEKKLMRVSAGGWSGTDKGGQASFEINGEPASLVVKFLTGLETIEHPFQFDNLPLRSASNMPEKLTPATFPGHEAPATLTLEKVARDRLQAKAMIQLTNHSDKEILAIEMGMVYLDSAGRKVGEWEIGQILPPTPLASTKDYPTLAPANGKKVVEAMAPFLPASATTIQFKLKKVKFADASVWVPKPKGK